MIDNTQRCLDILSDKGINPASEIDFDVNGEVHSLSLKYMIDTYMSASEESQHVFLGALQKASNAQESGITTFFEQMGQLLLMTHLSNKIEV